MALLVAHLAGKDALLALLFHVARLTLHALRAALGALEGGVQADGLVVGTEIQ